jgi:predicted Rossmann fold nucleotide-binding protein DprA/Smf involved in DNA uptake
VIRPRSSLLPTDRPWPEWTVEAIETRKNLYARIKSEPRTASHLSDQAGLPIAETIDELRHLENYGVIRHRADEMGVVSWHLIPGNKWEAEEPPF